MQYMNYVGKASLMRLEQCWRVWLLEQPAVKTNERDIIGYTALHYAAFGNNAEGARMLLLHPGFNLPNSISFGETALMMAVSFRKKEVLLELVQHESVSLDLSEGDFVGR